MKNNQTSNIESKEIKVDFKNIIKVVGLLYAILIIVGILTYIIPAGKYDVDEAGNKILSSFHYVTSTTRIPWYRWLTAPIEGLIFGSDISKILMIIALLVLLGGCFKVLEAGGAVSSLIKLIVTKFYKRRYLVVWLINLIMILLSSLFGLQEQLLILFPILLSFTLAMNWSKISALNFILISSGVGFTAALFNPFNVIICTEIMGISPMDGILYRILVLVVLYFTTSIYLVRFVKKEEKQNPKDIEQDLKNIEITDIDKSKSIMITSLFAFVLFVVVLFSAVPFLQKLGIGTIIMGVAFVVGTLFVGIKLLGGFKPWIKYFIKGVLDILPSTLIIVVAFSIKYILEKADVFDTIFKYIYDLSSSQSPYLAITIIFLFVLVIEFFIPSSSAKALLIMPILMVAPIPGISRNMLLLAYMFGDGYTNVIYPTCGTLMIGLGIADVGYFEWLKKNGLYLLFVLLLSLGFLYLGIFIGI